MINMPQINIFSENIHKCIKVDEKECIDVSKKILEYFLSDNEIFNNSCLKGQNFNCISFDILYCYSDKTHKINKEYRKKDYEADIITFAIFADSDEKFVFDEEINLGEIIISLDKTEKNSVKKGIDFKQELHFLISHGVMHLLGFDHQTDAEYNFIIDAQEKALNASR